MPKLGRDARRTLVAVAEVLGKTGCFPTVDEVAGTGRVADRGKASNSLKALERAGLVSRTAHGWKSGSLHHHGRTLAALYLSDEAAWLPPRRRMHRAPAGAQAAIANGRTLYPHQIKFPATGKPLRPGNSNAKLGGYVTKGKWAGLRILTLALEERRTCPRSCAVWAKCYGDNMSLSLRTPHGRELERRLERQLERLNGPVLVRLHELGDFYSAAYVGVWEGFLRRFPGLHVFGYTAWAPTTLIGAAVQAMNAAHPERCWIRTSGSGESMGAYVVQPGETRPDAFLCPEQTGLVPNCGACGACWATRKNVAFVEH